MTLGGKAKQCLAVLGMAGALVACDGQNHLKSQWQQARQGIEEGYQDTFSKPRHIPTNGGPQILVAASKITFDGEPLQLQGDFGDWVEVLGPDYRSWTPSDNVTRVGTYIWDDLGILVSLDWQGKQTVKGFEVSFTFKESSVADPENYVPGTGPFPSGTFPGYLEVGGVPIDAESTVREVNRRADGALSLRCMRGLGICSSFIDGDEDGLVVDVEVDGRKENSIVYRLSLSRGTVE